jgi:hypothetical protein
MRPRGLVESKERRFLMMWTRLQSPLMGAILLGLACTTLARADEKPPELTWLADYGQALRQAEEQQKKLVVYFHPTEAEDAAAFEKSALSDLTVSEALSHFVLAKVAADTSIKVAGQPVRLLEHPAFVSLGKRPGLAMLDLSSKDPARYMRVIAAYPIPATQPVAAVDLVAALEPHVPVEANLGAKLASRVQWHADYANAFAEAEKAKKPLLIYFQEEDASRKDRRFEDQTLRDGRVLRRLGRFVLARLPLAAETRTEGKKTRLLEHPGFAYMYGRQGVSVVDLANEKTPHYRHVVSAFPFSPHKHYDANRMATILDLPPGTITQRTLIYAVRTHQERPASTDGNHSSILAGEAESHSQYQAEIDNQGHHNWGHRFQRISAQLPGGLVAQEVCAESWPGQELVDAAEECISSWRQSSGHWGAVRQHHPFFGYDMKLGARRVWYATGIFGRHSGW